MSAKASKILKRQFEELAEYARRGGRPKPASCFDALAATVDQVSSQLFASYLESFQNIEDGKVDFALRQSIQQGLWSPGSATEFMERFIEINPSSAKPVRYQ